MVYGELAALLLDFIIFRKNFFEDGLIRGLFSAKF